MAEQTIGGRVYPIGIQSFQKIIEEGYTYVDKTFFVAKLVKESQYVFLSRPRRFGKSLLLSTIHAYFEGRRELFKGLAIDRLDMDWTARPVLHFDFNSEDYSADDALAKIISRQLEEYEEKYGMTDLSDTLSGRFSKLIRHITETTSKKVVILIDEYDKPLVELETDSELYEKRQRMLKGFFSNLKSMDEYIEFGMLSGVARFSKISIFSDLNNLDDISLENAYSEICGWTEAELTKYFQPGIQALADERTEEPAATISALRDYYDGYLFSPKGSPVYNPFSVMRALKAKAIMPYWFDTGTPTFLAKRIKKNGINPDSINGQTQSYNNLISVGADTHNVTALMFQTGYLTIDSFDPRRLRFTLRFPNHEVEIGFAENLLPLYAPSTTKSNSPFNIEKFRDDIDAGDPYGFMDRMVAMFKSIPGEDHKESTYRAVTYLLCLLSGIEAVPERHSYKGRSDLEILTPEYVYIFEFKYNKSVKEAMDQIYSRDYAGRFAKDHRKVFMIGANYMENKDSRKLEYKIEEMGCC